MSLEQREKNLVRFVEEYPRLTKQLTKSQILIIFDKFKSHRSRSFNQTNNSLIMFGTIVFIFSVTCLTNIHRIAAQEVASQINLQCFMNIMLGSLAAGCYVALVQMKGLTNLKPEKNGPNKYIETQDKYYDMVQLSCGFISGLVSCSAGAGQFSYYSSLLIGLVGGMLFSLAAPMVDRVQIDDPLYTSVTMGLCGTWAMVAVGIFDVDKGLISSGSMK